jgi:hypothetical protein
MKTTKHPVEKTTRFSTSTETLQEAWQFVMEHLDAAGEAPSISIDPFWEYDFDAIKPDTEGHRRFSVVVEWVEEQ